MVPLAYYLVVSTLLFSIGIYGVMTRRHAVRVLMCIELMINAANLNFVAFSAYNVPFNPAGQVFTIFSIAVAAAEAAIGLAIYILLARTHKTIDLLRVSNLKW